MGRITTVCGAGRGKDAAAWTRCVGSGSVNKHSLASVMSIVVSMTIPGNGNCRIMQ